MKTILAPTDFSPISFNAVKYAADMANALSADLLILHVYQTHIPFSEVPFPLDNAAEMLKNAEEKLKQIKSELTEQTSGKIRISTDVKIGTLITEIYNYCTELEPSAVIMGTLSSSAFERIFFGSNTIDAMKHLSWPLILVPPEAKFKSIKRIGLACDLNKIDDIAPLKEIKFLVQEFNADLHVLHVNSEDKKVYNAETVSEFHFLQKELENFKPIYHFLHSHDIEEGLSRSAAKNKLDLLIVVPKKHNIFDGLFHRSHSKKMILHTHLPVMAVHE